MTCVGDKTATDCGNIHRDVKTKPIIDNYPEIARHYGYLDDCGTIFVVSIERLSNLLRDLQNFDMHFKWEVVVTQQSMSILDLVISRGPTFHLDGQVAFACYRKPKHRPLYVSGTSMHKQSTKDAVFFTETNRMLINNSNTLAYERDIAALRKNFELRGHHFVSHVDVPYNHAKRDLILNRSANRIFYYTRS